MTTKEICDAEKNVLHNMASYVTDTNYFQTDYINLADCSNVYLLQVPDEVFLPQNPAFIKQRSQIWHDIRSQFKVTG